MRVCSTYGWTGQSVYGLYKSESLIDITVPKKQFVVCLDDVGWTTTNCNIFTQSLVFDGNTTPDDEHTFVAFNSILVSLIEANIVLCCDRSDEVVVVRQWNCGQVWAVSQLVLA